MGHHYSSVLQWVGSSIAICRNLCSSLVWLLPPSPPQRLMLMPITADTATVTSLPGLLHTVLASNPPSTEPVDTPTDTARGVLMLSPLLRLMLMLTTAMVDMVDTAVAMVMEDTVMDTDMATVVDTVMDMAMVTTDKLRGQIMFVQYCAIAILLKKI